MEQHLKNRKNQEVLRKELEQEEFNRITISFYRYVILENPEVLRDHLYRTWDALGCKGRIYLAKEGINAQMSVPEHQMDVFRAYLDSYKEFQHVPFKVAVEDDGKSFLKLAVKVKDKILADGQDDDSYDVTNVGTHLSALDFHDLVGKEDTLVVDMRNHYECEVGHFETAYLPKADTFREALTEVEEELKGKEDKKVLLYCTGGIRCEKASAYLKDKGFKDVNQLHGGIIEYAQQLKKHDVKSKYLGKNFVFDERMGESIDGTIISNCHQCGNPCDNHTNCVNDACHLLFIQCDDCKASMENCCSKECQEVLQMPEDKQRELRQDVAKKHGKGIYSKRLRPKGELLIK